MENLKIQSNGELEYRLFKNYRGEFCTCLVDNSVDMVIGVQIFQTLEAAEKRFDFLVKYTEKRSDT